MSGRMPWGKVTVSMVGVMGLGYILMKAVTPTPEELYQRMSPDLRRKVDAVRAQRLATEQAMQHHQPSTVSDPDTGKPVWADAPPAQR